MYGNTQYGNPSIQFGVCAWLPHYCCGQKKGWSAYRIVSQYRYIHKYTSTYTHSRMETLPGGSSRRITSLKASTALVALAVHLPPFLSFFACPPSLWGAVESFSSSFSLVDNGCLRFVLKGNDHVPGVNQSGSQPVLGLAGDYPGTPIIVGRLCRNALRIHGYRIIRFARLAILIMIYARPLE